MLLCRLLPLRPVAISNLFLDDPKLSNVQIFALDPSWPASEPIRVSPSNGTLRPVYLLQRDLKSSTVSSNGTTNLGQDRSKRGRSFSPPKKSSDNYENDQPERFINLNNSRNKKNLPKEHQGDDIFKEGVQKSSSSDHIRTIGKSPLSLSSASTTSSISGGSVREVNWQKNLRSGIPVPISSDSRLRFRTRPAEVGNKGPLLSTPPRIYRAQSPSPNDTPEKCIIPQRAVLARQPFSSGSETSEFYTPPAEPHLAFTTQAEDIPVQPQDTERFVKVETPKNNKVNFTVLHGISIDYEQNRAVNRLERQDLTFDQDDPPFDTGENIFGQEIVPSERENTSHSLDDLDGLEYYDTSNRFMENRCLSKSEINLQQSSTIPRKVINSAPALNEFSVEYQCFDDTPIGSTKASLPGSVIDFIDETDLEVQQETKAIMPCASKTGCRKNPLPKQLSRRNSVRTSKKEITPFPDNLRPFPKPKEGLNETLIQLESCDWEVTMKGLQGVVKLIRFHRDELEANMHSVCVGLGKHIRNLRSQVSRAACVAASEMFSNHKKALDVHLEELVVPLLHRTADTNKFLRCDANGALDIMSYNTAPSRVVTLVATKGGGHQNAIVRCTAARLLCALTHRLGPDKVFQLPKETRDKILSMGATMLTEGNLETRKHSKMMLSLLSHHSHFHKAITEAVPTTTIRHIQKTLQNLK